MKRKELLAKSLAVGLAVAMAASSMSTPGGLLAPIEVLAADAITESSAREHFELVNTEMTLPESGKLSAGDVVKLKDGKTEEEVGTYKITFARSAEESLEELEEAGSYTVFVQITEEGSVLAPTNDNSPVELGKITVYEAFKGTLKLAASTALLKY